MHARTQLVLSEPIEPTSNVLEFIPSDALMVFSMSLSRQTDCVAVETCTANG